MPAVVLKGHHCSGHGCYPSRPNTQGEPRFTVGTIPVHLQTHSWASHCCTAPPHPCHGGSMAAGSARFTVGGLQIARIGDPVDCGSVAAEGTPRFTVGD